MPVGDFALHLEKLLYGVVVLVLQQLGQRVDGFLNRTAAGAEVDILVGEIGAVGLGGKNFFYVGGDLFDDSIKGFGRDPDGDVVVGAFLDGVAIDHPSTTPNGEVADCVDSCRGVVRFDPHVGVADDDAVCGLERDVDVLSELLLGHLHFHRLRRHFSRAGLHDFLDGHFFFDDYRLCRHFYYLLDGDGSNGEIVAGIVSDGEP